MQSSEWKLKFTVDNRIDRDIDAEDKETLPGVTLEPNPKWKVEPNEKQIFNLDSKQTDVNSQGGGIKFGLFFVGKPMKIYFYVLGTQCGLSVSSFEEAKKTTAQVARLNFGETYKVVAWYDDKKG